MKRDDPALDPFNTLSELVRKHLRAANKIFWCTVAVFVAVLLNALLSLGRFLQWWS